MLFISHDLGVVGEIADHVVVMRQGLVREQGPVAGIFASPQDAYTRALLACRPTLGQRRPRLMVIDDHLAGTGAPMRRSPRIPLRRWSSRRMRSRRASGSAAASSAAPNSRP
jgi:peptide/nickel transport system ATP-binding protein